MKHKILDAPGAAKVHLHNVLYAMRTWRKARDRGIGVQPELYRFFQSKGGGMLAPVLDSVFTLREALLKRSLRAGEGVCWSDDERELLRYFENPEVPVPNQTMASAFLSAVHTASSMLNALPIEHKSA